MQFVPHFNLNKWFLHKLEFCFLVLFSDFVVSVRRCMIFHLCATFIWFPILIRCPFALPSCCGIRLVQIERSRLINYWFNQWQGRQRCKSGNMSISVTFILSHYLYAWVCLSMLLTWMLWVCLQIHHFRF
jgi:hypothetical protein